ncbi:hypothetical protein D3C86_1718600 [compost metagenome]
MDNICHPFMPLSKQLVIKADPVIIKCCPFLRLRHRNLLKGFIGGIVHGIQLSNVRIHLLQIILPCGLLRRIFIRGEHRLIGQHDILESVIILDHGNQGAQIILNHLPCLRMVKVEFDEAAVIGTDFRVLLQQEFREVVR